MKRFTVLLAFLVFLISGLYAQNVQITGSVTSSEDGSPLPGVSVVVKGTTIGTVTDYKGEYVISAPQDATTLVFSFVGMSDKEVPIEGRTTIDVAMDPDLLQLDEVVVTALGITREKKSLGYAVQEVDGEEITRGSNPNLANAISGRIAGIEVRKSSGMPGAPATVLIRGARSFSGNNQPLYVVDGLPISSNPDYSNNVTGAYSSGRSLDIDPNNIENINVLKGQAAAALYGLRASNGVIIITTKSGRGLQSNTPKVDISFDYLADEIGTLPEVQDQWAQGFGGGFIPAFSLSWGPAISDLPDDPTYGGNTREQSGLFFDPYKGEWVTPQAYNNPEAFFQTGHTYSTNVTVTQGNETSSYVLGLSNTTQNGIVKNSGMDRYNAKIGADFNIGDKWSAGFSGNYSDVALNKLPSGNDSWLFTVYGAPPSFDLMGTPFHQEGTLGEFRQISYRTGGVGLNPRWAIENNQYQEQTKRFFGNAFLNYNPFPWMGVKYQLGIDTYSTDNEDISQAGIGDLPGAAEYPTPENPEYAFVQPTGGSVDNYGLSRSTLTSLFNINFTRSFGYINT